MPIKFRCQQCRQFLGISRAQAGEVVDCPTCGRTIRVPELDGTVKPLPEPGLQFDDTRLKSALDEIALIGDKPSLSEQLEDDGEAVEKSADDDDASQEKPATRGAGATMDEPRAIDLPPLPAPEPVALGPLPQRDIDYGAAAEDEALSGESSEEDRPWRSTAQPRDSWKQLIAAAALKEQEEWDRSKEPEDAGLADQTATAESSESDSAEDVSSEDPVQVATALDEESISLGFSTWFAIIGLIALICSAGFWIGRGTAITFSVDGSTSTDAGASSAGGEAATEPAPLKSGIEGRITFQREAGQWAADRDACVIVLPVERAGESLVSFYGLQQDGSDEDREMARSSLRAMGGAIGLADEHGRFQIELTKPGKYHVLVLSRSAGRSETSDDEATINTLSSYFDRAEQMLGQLAYRFETIRFSGQSVLPLDTGFGLQD